MPSERLPYHVTEPAELAARVILRKFIDPDGEDDASITTTEAMFHPMKGFIEGVVQEAILRSHAKGERIKRRIQQRAQR